MATFKRMIPTLIPAIFLSFALIYSCEGDRSIDPALQRQIDSLLQDIYLPLSNISGLGLAIVQNNGELLYTTGYGLADQERGIPNSNNTQFLIGSATKSFTSAVVVKVLHEKFPEMGESVLDTPIRKLLPQANFTLIDRFRSEYASFRDLLAHRLCLFRDDLQLTADVFNSSAEIVYRQRYNKEICAVRTDFQYNNQMYVAAGELIGMLAGKSYSDLVQDLLTEIGMLNSSLTKITDDFSNMPNRGMPYYVMDNITYPINTDLIKRVVPSNAAGGLYLTPNDMAKYTRFLLNNGEIDGKQIIPAEAMKWMKKSVNLLNMVNYKDQEGQKIGSYFGYGLGLMIGSYDGWQHIHHGGYFPPYSSLMSLFPEKNLTIFTSTNMGPVYVDSQLLHRALFEIISRTENATENAVKSFESNLKLKEAEKDKKQLTLEGLINEHKLKPMNSQNMSEILGKYGSGSSGELEITERFNNQTNSTGLYLSYTRWAQGWLENLSGDLYKLNLVTDVVQDNYASGVRDGSSYCKIANETLDFVQPMVDGVISLGSFKLGVSLDNLPPVPWLPDSCGPE